MKLMFAIAALAIVVCGVANAKGYHYRAPKLSTYHIPKTYAPHYSGPTRVRSYLKADGTYVMPHVRTAPNATWLDNWSTKGNVNPYTGKLGTKDPYAPPSSGG